MRLTKLVVEDGRSINEPTSLRFERCPEDVKGCKSRGIAGLGADVLLAGVPVLAVKQRQFKR